MQLSLALGNTCVVGTVGGHLPLSRNPLAQRIELGFQVTIPLPFLLRRGVKTTMFSLAQ